MAGAAIRDPQSALRHLARDDAHWGPARLQRLVAGNGHSRPRDSLPAVYEPLGALSRPRRLSRVHHPHAHPVADRVLGGAAELGYRAQVWADRPPEPGGIVADLRLPYPPDWRHAAALRATGGPVSQRTARPAPGHHARRPPEPVNARRVREL